MSEINKSLRKTFGNEVEYSSFSGADIDVYLFFPSNGIPSKDKANTTNNIKLGSLQTLSISSTRSISPVRVLGRTNPLAYLRGARTFAGSLVFASVFKDQLHASRLAVSENLNIASNNLFVDQLPPFTIVVTIATELGEVAQQVITGVTLVNYGTVYSVDDIYTEVSYSYLATDVSPLMTSEQSTQYIKNMLSYDYLKEVLPTPMDFINSRREYLRTDNSYDDYIRYLFRQKGI
jgi:hypothetical protein